MTPDLIEQLAKSPVPSVPETLEPQIHQRVNDWLVLLHLGDLLLRGLPYAMWQFARAVAALIVFSVKGRFPSK
jgi:hypothetical protein